LPEVLTQQQSLDHGSFLQFFKNDLYCVSELVNCSAV